MPQTAAPKARKTRRGEYGDYWLETDARSPYWHRVRYLAEKRRYEKISLEETDFDSAHRKLIAYVDAHLRADKRDPEVVKLHAILNWYWETHGQHTAKPKVQLHAVKKWKAFFDAETTIAGLTPDRIDDFVKDMLATGSALGGASRVLTVGRAALNRARDRMIVLAVPKIKDCMTQEDREGADPMGRPLDLKELAALFKADPPFHIETFMAISIHTMCRPGAALDLGRGQVDFDHGVIDLNPKGRRQNKKRRPVLKMTKTLGTILRAVEAAAVAEAEEIGDARFKFDRYVTWRGKPIKNINRAFAELVERAGLAGTNVTLYSIRHTMGRELRRQRVTSEEISLFLGHKPKNVSQATSFYAPYDPDYLGGAAAAIEDFADRLRAEITGVESTAQRKAA